MADFFNKTNKIGEFLKTKKGAVIIIIIGLTGIFLTTFSGSCSSESQKTINNTVSFSTTEYTLHLEQKLENLVDDLCGSKNSNVIVALESGPEYIYATREKNSADISESSKDNSYQKSTTDEGENEYIIIKTDNGEEALVITELQPRIKGVAVVCGGDVSDQTIQIIKESLATLLDISSTKISVGSKRITK